MIAESCTQEEVKVVIRALLSELFEDYDSLALNDRTKGLISSFLRGKSFQLVKESFLAVFMSTEKSSGTKIKPVFTAPKKYQPSQNSTKDELTKLIRSAKSSIYILGFWLTANVKEIIDALCEASNGGVKIIIVADSMDNFLQPLHQKWWAKEKPSAYLIKKSATYSSDTKMHAKTLVVDEQRLFITSANLTYLGLNENLEIGLVIENQAATKKICEFISQVIHDVEFFEKIRLS